MIIYSAARSSPQPLDLCLHSPMTSAYSAMRSVFAAHQASLSITNSRSPSKPMSIESVMPYNHLILCRPLLLLPPIFASTPQLEKNHVVPIAWQDEALARDGVSREVPCSALKGETVPDSLPAQKTLSAFDKPCWASPEQTSHLPKHLVPEIKPVNN